MDQLCSDIHISELGGFANVVIYYAQQTERAVTEHAGTINTCFMVVPQRYSDARTKQRVDVQSLDVFVLSTSSQFTHLCLLTDRGGHMRANSLPVILNVS